MSEARGWLSRLADRSCLARAATERASLGGARLRAAARCSGAASATCRSCGTRWSTSATPGERRRTSSRACWSSATVFAARERARPRPSAAQARDAASARNPIYLPAPHEVARALTPRSRTPPRAADRAVAAREPVAQHPGDLLGLPAVVAARRAARHPVRHLPALVAADRAVRRVLPLHAGAGVRRAGGRGARHLRRAQDRDHLHRHVLPAGAGGRQHHAQARACRCSRRRRRSARTRASWCSTWSCRA